MERSPLGDHTLRCPSCRKKQNTHSNPRVQRGTKIEKERWVWSIVMMVWLGCGDSWNRLIREHGANIGMRELWPSVAMSWSRDTPSIPHIADIIRILGRILHKGQETGPIWLFGDEEQKCNSSTSLHRASAPWSHLFKQPNISRQSTQAAFSRKGSMLGHCRRLRLQGSYPGGNQGAGEVY